MTNQPRDFTLRGYFGALRRNKWLILALAVIGILAGFGYTRLQSKSYSATASLAVTDPSQQLALIGGQYVPNQTPLQLASAAAPQVTRPAVTQAVTRSLGGSVKASDLAGVQVAVDANSYVLHITASSSTANQAAAIANAYAQQDAAISNAQARAQYAADGKALHSQLAHTSPTSPEFLTNVETESRLSQLSKLAKPITVSNLATPPGSPSSPKTTTDTLAGLLLGLLLGIALATMRDALDRRLRHSREVVKVLDHPVLGHIRSEALGRAGTSAGGTGGLGPLAPADQESFRILRQNIVYLGAAGSGRTVLVTSAMAEEGKSTVAACLAVATAEAGARTLLVECDLRRPVLAKRFGLRESPGLSDYLTGHASPEQILQPVAGIVPRGNGADPAHANGHLGASNLVCITAGTTAPGPAELMASDAFHSFLREVAAVYDSVILDTPPLLPVADTLAIVPDVSMLLVCVRLDRTTRDQARAAQSALARLPERPIGLVLTDVRQHEDGYYYGYYGSPTAQPELTPAA
jgi:Mrp family chromosome partitioning ATPase/capsular polysaccharide biosynthesis protein